jgi:hypothetical protein
MRSRSSRTNPSENPPNWGWLLTLTTGLVLLVVSPQRLGKAGARAQKASGNTKPAGGLLLEPSGRKGHELPPPERKPPDALMYRYTSSGAIAHTVVTGHEAIRAFKACGWQVLCHEQDIRWADLDDVRQLDMTRFDQWLDPWKRSIGQ